ncbi:peptidase M23 [Colidextribacter sp. OB.20]|uniref:murein hydrolase activator EnvC family protein n=1 Tax=Colidextribacter sp. OB.20 TaxID=2304568 RepID=UPI00136E0C63|nr:peptidoglycan DD-metalloendopeptidase family protein [Colidextribacter sp. OB.20]NBI10694.1 peptidase M23 [Colidextribacter sp. OB.20]
MKNRGKLLRRALGLLLAAALLLPLTGPGVVLEASAVTKAEIDALKGDAKDLASQRKEIQEKLKAVQADKNAAIAKKELIEHQIDLIQQEINNIKQQIAMYDQLIAEKGEELRQAEADEAAQFDLFCRRMRDMEEQGEVSYWEILFSSSSFSDLLDNYMMIEEIIQYDNKVISDLEALQTRVSEDKAALEEAQAEQEEAKRQQEAAKAELKAREDEIEALIKEISAQEDQLEAMEKELDQAAKNLDAAIKKAEKEYAAQIANVPSESGYLWPLPGNVNTLSSYYGPRKDPFTGKAKNHTGIDVPAARGTPIYAAKSGVVTTSVLGSGGSWAYGNHVVVSHSDGTSTLYAHMNSRAVKQGQVVKQGDVVGYVGTTGRSTGNHLHYEVRINGNRTDPLNYYKDRALYYRGSGGTVPVWDWMK